MRRAALYICYYNVDEPLVQTQVIAYLQELAKLGIEMHLLTFERERHSEEKRKSTFQCLAEAGIRWHTLRYHQRPSLPATLYDIAAGTIAAMRICRKYGIELVHARSHVPAAIALTLKRLLGCRFVFDLRGLLAEEYVDAGHWTEGDLKFRLTKRMERAFFQTADAFVMLTHRIKDELVKRDPALQLRADDIQVIPCCVDVERFPVDPQQRITYRQNRGWTDRLVLTYVGKLGTWYLPDEMARFFAVAQRLDDRFFFQVLTQSVPALMETAFKAAGVPRESYDIRFATPSDLPLILTSSDAGISFIRPCYSKRASSPTKVGEYLAAGLPVVANSGIGDSDEMICTNRLGGVINDFSDAEYCRVAEELRKLLMTNDTSSRCRDYAELELGLATVGARRYAAVYERLLNSRSETNVRQSYGEAPVGLKDLK